METITFIDKIQETPTDWSFRFTKPEGYTYEAGQYSVLRMPMLFPDDRHGARTCSLSSSPTEDFLQFTFTVRETGYKKTLMQLHQGSQAQITPARGPLVLSKVMTGKLCMIAGGIGVAPFRGIAKYLDDTQATLPKASLVYSDKNHHEIAFAKEWGEYENLSVFITLTRHEDTHPTWDGFTGRISWEMLGACGSTDSDTTYMICGAPEMVKDTQEMLQAHNISRDQIISELFTGY